jgi:hypothetical protein
MAELGRNAIEGGHLSRGDLVEPAEIGVQLR